MSMMSLYVLALELMAFFGFLCVLCNILLPVLAFLLRFLLVDVPREWRKLLLHRAQQRELRRLQRRVDVLTRRKQAEEQESRRRARASAQKRQWTEETPTKGTADGRLNTDLARTEQNSLNEKNSSTQERAFTPEQQRHRLSIHSTIKKSAISARLRTR
ncbi:unnamed protein product [Peronospora farinosa]|uniref:Uncharacterized protein n=1 Tax=Peronospora farinosa TaxID=134698 RepID=A0AAV0UI50_9STRA|nr:unnamed protein product [Peronospora farinosa]CAI5736481.1 unnamed protein product [Peronospora farinosa]